MADLNIRNVDVTLVTDLKVRALSAGKTLREYCIGLLGGSNGPEGSGSDDSRVAGDETKDQRRSRVRASVPVVRRSESKAEHVHSVQQARGELVQRGRSEQGPSTETHAEHRTYRNGLKHWCSDCQVEF